MVLRSLFGLALLALAAPAAAGDAAGRERDWFDSGRLLTTSGVVQVEGAGGGGLAPWALITGYGTRDAVGGQAHYTLVRLPDFTLHTAGVGVGLFDRVELSYARQWFDTEDAGAALGLGRSFTFHQDIIGAKVRLFGDAVYDQDTWLPQVAVGLQYKINDRGTIIRAVGGRDDEGLDLYVSATKVLLAQNLLLNATVRATRANQFGLLGFGGDRNDDYTLQFEGSAAYLVTRELAIGGEYRTRPDNLGFAREQDAFDVFVAYFFNKNLSATLAYVALGDIATFRNQDGLYLSIQAGF
ncbi:DUF3034 family protein [Zavarzinia sp. CC-PAN008]|uniref:DUF3034 family protein n=1 Tax=Zavarzinia sp. CC-PAN008 TaxID=3243332 RepID=UPI003F748586